MDQRTPEWFTSRMGKVTASRVADVMAKTKTGPSASRQSYMDQLVVEILTGQRAESFSSTAMQWGTDTEPLARAAYEARVGDFVSETGFHLHPRIEQSGASPDGLIGDGLLEIKCPNSSTHCDVLVNKKVPGKYVIQMQWQMACLNRPWCDFVSYDPRMPLELQMFLTRVERDDTHIQTLENEVEIFLGELNQRITQLKEAA
jgi:putative phage-type endonuclease